MTVVTSALKLVQVASTFAQTAERLRRFPKRTKRGTDPIDTDAVLSDQWFRHYILQVLTRHASPQRLRCKTSIMQCWACAAHVTVTCPRGDVHLLYISTSLCISPLHALQEALQCSARWHSGCARSRAQCISEVHAVCHLSRTANCPGARNQVDWGQMRLARPGVLEGLIIISPLVLPLWKKFFGGPDRAGGVNGGLM